MTHDDLILDRYEPIGVAGAGGFGTVQIAWDPRIQRKVAIKAIRLTALDAARAALPGAQAVSPVDTSDRWHGATPWNEYLADEPVGANESLPEGEHGEELPFDEDARLRHEVDGGSVAGERRDVQVTSLAHLPGLDEARTAAMLSDQRIVTVYDFEVRGRMAYLIMEYVEGITLTRLLASYPDYITLDLVAAVFDAVAGALSAAHGAGVLHLDIKPDNILINAQGQVKVTDFGLATLADASGVGTTGGGTIGYMPLEQMRREHLDARTDEWSLASVTYEMLTGDNPFRASNLAEAEAAIEDAELILPSLCWEDLDEQADDVVFYALDPDREERYESVSDFAEEMDKFLGDPAEGTELLALVVQDALGMQDEPEDGAFYEADEEYDDWGEDDEPLPERPRAFGRMATLLVAGLRDSGIGADKDDYGANRGERARIDDDLAEDGAAGGGGLRERRKAARAERGPHVPLADRVAQGALDLAARLFSAGAGGFVAWLALSNMRPLTLAFGSGASYVAGIAAFAMAVLAGVWANVGALVAFCLLGMSIVVCGHPVVGSVVLVATVAWWYAFGHDGKASANTALLTPLLGAVGGASAVPFVAGAALRPAQAIATTAFAAVVAFALATFGSGTLLGWDAVAHWSFAEADIAGNAMALATRPSTWLTAAGWVAAAAVLASLGERDHRVLSLLGLAVAAVIVIGSSMAFSTVSPQLIVSVALAAAVLLVAFA